MREKRGFTLAEVLITLVVIGVVTAITVPILRNDTADKKWNVARQKAQATIGEAFKLMTVNGEITDKLTTEEFVNKVITKYLKLERTCKPNDYKQCGFPSKIKRPDGKVVSTTPSTWTWATLSPATIFRESTTSVYNSANHTDSYFFRTLDGFSVVKINNLI